MPAGAAIPGLVLCFAATVLLVFTCVSAPTWEKISFLDVGDNLRYGVFGHTGSTSRNIGYDFVGVGGSQDDGILGLNSGTLHNLTKVLILHPIAAGLSFLSLLFGICGAARSRVGTILMSLSAALAFIVTLVIFIIDMVLFGIARNRYKAADIPAQYGNANWLTLGALIALLLGFCVGICGSFGRYRRDHY